MTFAGLAANFRQPRVGSSLSILASIRMAVQDAISGLHIWDCLRGSIDEQMAIGASYAQRSDLHDVFRVVPARSFCQPGIYWTGLDGHHKVFHLSHNSLSSWECGRIILFILEDV